MAKALLERESLDGEEVKILLSGGILPPMKKRPEQDKADPTPPTEPEASKKPEVSDEAPSSEEPPDIDKSDETIKDEPGPTDLFSDIDAKDEDPGTKT